MESLPVEISLEILKRVISSSQTPNTLCNLLKASPILLRIYLAHRYELLNNHIDNLHTTIEEDVARILALAKKDERAMRIRRQDASINPFYFPTRITPDELATVLLTALREGSFADLAWVNILDRLSKMSKNRDMFGLSKGYMDNIVESVQQFKWAWDVVEGWDTVLYDFMVINYPPRR